MILYIYSQIWDYYFKWTVPFHKLSFIYIVPACVKR